MLDSVLNFLIQGTDLSLWGFFGLCGISFVGSLITAALGLGGGLLALATMTVVLSPTVLIPLHGIVQIGSNGFRAVLMRRHRWHKYSPPGAPKSLANRVVRDHHIANSMLGGHHHG